MAEAKVQLQAKRAEIVATEVSTRMGAVTQKWVEQLEEEMEKNRAELKRKKEDQLMALLEEKRRLYEERAGLRHSLRQRGIEI